MACWDSKRPKLDSNGNLCLPTDPCGPCMSPPLFQGTLIPSNGQGKSLAAFIQRDTRRDFYVMYGADEDLNVIQLLRSRDKIKLLPENGEGPCRTVLANSTLFNSVLNLFSDTC